MRYARPCALCPREPILGRSDEEHPVSSSACLTGNSISLLSTRRYHSVRLDAVHYCEREIDLAQKRKRRSFFERNGVPRDATQQRLQLFCKTVRGQQYLAFRVQILKMPYMTREASKADLARTVAVLPNLRYVDVPEGLYSDDPSCMALRQELQHQCPDIRKMGYTAGAEHSFTMLAHTRQWQNLEVLELRGLSIQPDTLLYVLASFPSLHEVKLGAVPCVDDSILTQNSLLPPFPPLFNLTFEDAPSITAFGLISYLSRPGTREVLTHLTLTETGVLPQDLPAILAKAPHLETLVINESVSRSFPLTQVPPLASKSLRSLHFEILPTTGSASAAAETYYSYLATSLLSSTLPHLTSLYAYSTSLPDLLLFPPVTPFGGLGAVGEKPRSRFSAYSTTSSVYSSPFQAHAFPISNTLSGLLSPLHLYTKPASAPELEWSVTIIDPPSDRNGRRGSATVARPVSLVERERTPSPHSEASGRKDSTLVGNGFGGFLAIPVKEAGSRRRRSSDQGHRKSSSDASGWMG